jgi:hypothetical protein
VTELRTAMTELAEQSKAYDVVLPAIQVARRRRRLARVGGTVALGAALIGLVAVTLPRGAETVSPPGQRPSVNGLPEQLVLPERTPPRLPDDRPVGPGVLVSVPNSFGGERPVLLTERGEFYQLAVAATRADGQTATPATLSPDGRWLGEPTDYRYRLRDLTSTTVYTLPSGTNPRSWSPDGRWLLIEVAGGQGDVQRMDLTDGTTVPVGGLGADWWPAGVLDTGEIVAVRLPERVLLTRTIEAKRINPVTGAESGHLRRDVTAQLEPGYGLLVTGTTIAPDGTTFAVPELRWEDTSAVGPTRAVFVIGPTADDVRRYSLPTPPEPAPATQTPGGIRHAPESDLVGFLPEGLLLATTGRETNTLDLLDRDTGTIRVVTRLPGATSIIVRERG